MHPRYLPAAVALALALGALPASAQTAAPVTCESAELCAPFPRPVGLYISGVEEDGRYLALEDGSLWEVEISDRATTASWRADDFVNLSWIAAPRGDFEYLLTHGANREQRAAVRLAGRRSGHVEEPMDRESTDEPLDQEPMDQEPPAQE